MEATARKDKEDKEDKECDLDIATKLLLSRSEHIKLKKLSSWKQNYKTPQDQNSSTKIFIAELCSEHLENEIETIFQLIKENFKFKRKEISSSIAEDGTAAIVTPNFSYSVSSELNPANTSEVAWTKHLDKVSSLELLNTSAFSNVFNNHFDTISFSFSSRITLSDFIDKTEEAEIPQLKLRYDSKCTYCELQLGNLNTSVIRVTENSLLISHQGVTQVSALLESFQSIHALISRQRSQRLAD